MAPPVRLARALYHLRFWRYRGRPKYLKLETKTASHCAVRNDTEDTVNVGRKRLCLALFVTEKCRNRTSGYVAPQHIVSAKASRAKRAYRLRRTSSQTYNKQNVLVLADPTNGANRPVTPFDACVNMSLGLAG